MQAFKTARLRILSHNVFWFQGVPFETDQPGLPKPGILQECVTIYRRLEPDVLCLQEVQNRETAMTLAEALGLKVHYTPGGTLPQYGGCILARGGKLLAWSCRESMQRMWQILKCESESGRGLKIANVHLPSDRQLDLAEAKKKRLLELQQVLALEPDVICGDLNERPHGEVAAELAHAGYSDCAVLTRNEDRSTSIGARRTDYIWIRATLADRVRDFGLVPPHSFLSKVPGKTFISDHVPLWVDIEVE